jgi:hypothetical protein
MNFMFHPTGELLVKFSMNIPSRDFEFRLNGCPVCFSGEPPLILAISVRE